MEKIQAIPKTPSFTCNDCGRKTYNWGFRDAKRVRCLGCGSEYGDYRDSSDFIRPSTLGTTYVYDYEQEVDENMSESQSRYSIIENLTKEKSATENMVKQIKQTLLQRDKDHKRMLEDNERSIRQQGEDLELFKKQAQLDIEFQEKKVAELDKAINGIKDISQAIEKKETQ